MPETIRDVMTDNPRTVESKGSLVDAAKAMRDEDVGSVIVVENGRVCGIVTDRDISIRAVAEGRNPSETQVSEVCSEDITTLSPGDSVEDAIAQMRKQDIRRLPVVEGDKPVGIVSLGDLAVDRDADSVLADISAAAPNR